jgi:hypothetical protein
MLFLLLIIIFVVWLVTPARAITLPIRLAIAGIHYGAVDPISCSLSWL